MKERSARKPIHAIRIILIFILLAIAITAAILCAKLYSFYRVEHDKLDLTWTNKKDVSIFKASYTDGDGIVTVRGEEEDDVVAPGTSNSYQFRLQNTFEVGMDYTLTLKASGANESFALPVYVKLYTLDGEYIAGTAEQGVRLSDLKSVSHSKTLDIDGYTDYVFFWEWPFEQGLDDYDTVLATTDASEVPVFSVSLGTTSVPNYERSGGLTKYNIYRTTMYVPVLILIVLIIVGLILLLISYLFRRKEQTSVPAFAAANEAEGTERSEDTHEDEGDGNRQEGVGEPSDQETASDTLPENQKEDLNAQGDESSDWRSHLLALGTVVALGVMSIWIDKSKKEKKEKKDKKKRR